MSARPSGAAGARNARGTGNRLGGERDYATPRALSRGQVRTLLVDAEARRSGIPLRGFGRLAIAERECRSAASPIPVPDVVDEAIEEALRQRVELEVVFEAEARCGGRDRRGLG